ncbi:hypothetical protein ABZ471_44045, partial [Streptomyces sp. NPDC005728]
SMAHAVSVPPSTPLRHSPVHTINGYENLGRPQSTVQLGSQQLIERRPHPIDRRAKQLNLTPKAPSAGKVC